jgi:hypothetical protein
MFLIINDSVKGERLINFDKIKSVQPFTETDYTKEGGFKFARSTERTVVEYVDGTSETLGVPYEELKRCMVGATLVSDALV